MANNFLDETPRELQKPEIQRKMGITTEDENVRGITKNKNDPCIDLLYLEKFQDTIENK